MKKSNFMKTKKKAAKMEDTCNNNNNNNNNCDISQLSWLSARERKSESERRAHFGMAHK